MKKFFILAALAVTSLTASAQLEAGHIMITPYISGGYGNVSNYKYRDSFTGETKKLNSGSAGSLGVDVQYNCSEKFGVSLGANFTSYTSAEAKTIGSTGVPIFQDQIEANFVNIPVLAHYQFNNHLSAKAGLQPGFLIKFENENVSEKEYCNSFNLSIPVGLAWKFNSPIELGVQYNIPVTHINKVSDSDGNWKYSSFNITLGWRFQL